MRTIETAPGSAKSRLLVGVNMLHQCWLVWLLLVMLATGYVLTQGMHGIDPGVAAFIGSLIGNLSSKAEMVYNYYFGSSMSSKSKDQMLFNSTPTK